MRFPARWAIVLVPAVLTACSGTVGHPAVPTPAIAATSTASPLTHSIVAVEPQAYTGMCSVEWRANSWRQPGLPGGSRYYRDGESPVPCANLEAEIGLTGPTAPSPNQQFYVARSWQGELSSTTDKIWITAVRKTGGTWLVTWGAKPGTRVVWAYVFDGPGKIGAATGHFLWHPFGGQTYPSVDIYANDLDAPPGRYIPVTGPPILTPN